MERWSGKVALVTGASAGIGASITEELAKHGLKVVALARRVDKIEELKKNLGSVKGEVIPLKGDVSKEEDINQTFRWIKNKFGTIDVLVNNAGIVRLGSLLDGKPEDFRQTFDVNVLGLTLCTQQAVKLMRETGVNDGHIIHINSVAGHAVPKFDGLSILNVYSASKYAVTALTESLRQELNFIKSQIRVTSISPGAVSTEIADASTRATGEQLSEEVKQYYATIPYLEPKDIADAVLYVLSTHPRVQVHELTIKPVGERV